MSKKFTFQGVLEYIEPNITFQSKNGDNFVKSQITFDDSETYNGKVIENKVTFVLNGAERARKAETLIVGHTYDVRFYISSRRFNDKVYTSLSAIDVLDITGAQPLPAQQPTPTPMPQAPTPPPAAYPSTTDDLPF
jgi:hypothetical protein